jgi:hypothetical protein
MRELSAEGKRAIGVIGSIRAFVLGASCSTGLGRVRVHDALALES